MSALLRKHNFDQVFDSQKMFRLLLEAAANPVKPVNVSNFMEKLNGDYSGFLAVAVTLLDNETNFCVTDGSGLRDEIAHVTLSAAVSADEADYIFVTDDICIRDAVGNAKRGTLTNPHKSATLIIRNNGEAEHLLRFKGPGINGDMRANVSQTVKNSISLRDAQNYEYPQGIDLIFVSDSGGLFAVPRLVQAEVM